MSSADQTEQQGVASPAETTVEKRVRRRWWRVSLALLLVVLVVIALVWSNRNTIATQQIDQQLDGLGLEATYDVESIGTRSQVLKNIVIGNPDRPDLTVERAEVLLKASLTGSFIDQVILDKPVFYGSYRDDKLSFGKLDPVIFTESEGPFELPDLKLEIRDGRGLIQSDFGDLGLSINSNGHLRGGFEAIVGAAMPKLSYAGCSASDLTMLGKVSIDAERPRLEGPLKVAQTKCENGAQLGDLAVQIQVGSDRLLATYDADLDIERGAIAFGDIRLGNISGESQVSWKDDLLVADYDLKGAQFAAPQAKLAKVSLTGDFRALDGFERSEARATLAGEGLALGSSLDGQLVGLVTATEGTLVAPLLAKLRSGLRRDLPGSRFAADLLWRDSDEGMSILVPQAQLVSRGGAPLLDTSRLQIAFRDGVAPRIAGNFITAGPALPQAAGRFDLQNGNTILDFAMREYRSGDSAVSMPEMELVLDRSGGIRFAGRATATGPIPDGRIVDLSAPVMGSLASNGSLSLWSQCTDVAFAGLTYADLELANRRLRICPQAGGAIVRNDGAGLRIAAIIPDASLAGDYGADSFALKSASLAVNYDTASDEFTASARNANVSGRYGEDIFALKSADVLVSYDVARGEFATSASNAAVSGRYAGQTFAFQSPNATLNKAGLLTAPNSGLTIGRGSSAARIRWSDFSAEVGDLGNAALSDVEVEVGLGDGLTRMTFANVSAALGDTITGQFNDGDVAITPVPLDIFDASGSFTFVDGILSVFDGEFRLEDRAEEDRFKPLFGRTATLMWDGDIIQADAPMFGASNAQQILSASILHSLTVGNGFADLTVDGLQFDPNLQPDDLTELALGVVANVDGALSGTGRIDWNPAGEVSSSGRFATQQLDLAAPFGPAKGLSGEIVFTDLLSFTTAPDQSISVQSINPGIEVFDGILNYRLENGQLMVIDEGTWPFLGGTLTLERSEFGFTREERRDFKMIIRGAEAALFIEQLEIGNLTATGKFDGELPLVFEGVEGRIVGGNLTARAPGGNLSYVGELTYEDMGAITNFAFDALRSLDYQGMTLQIDGPLTGDLVTKVQFTGISQGDGASKNLITRQIAKLPIQFNVNVKAPFYKLISSVRSIYDPAFVRDPRDVGLIDGDEGLPPRDEDSLGEALDKIEKTSPE